jgi:hydroxymethylbilane synthase
MTRLLRLGTRGSALALAQAREVEARLQSLYPSVSVERIIIKTTGDTLSQSSLSQGGGKGIFVKEIEEALLERRVDLAAHSLKDLPTDQPAGLMVAAVLEREDPRDCLISRFGEQLLELPRGALVGTGSLRRRAQVLAAKKEVRVTDMRGNLDTRLRKVQEGDVTSIVVAYAGMRRLGRQEEVSEVLPYDLILPAPGQGFIALEIRSDDDKTRAVVEKINSASGFRTAKAERSFLGSLGRGCRVPIAAYAREENGQLVLDGLVISSDGTKHVRSQETGPWENPEILGKRLGEKLLRAGAREILDGIHEH